MGMHIAHWKLKSIAELEKKVNSSKKTVKANSKEKNK